MFRDAELFVILAQARIHVQTSKWILVFTRMTKCRLHDSPFTIHHSRFAICDLRAPLTADR
jgi:hypothetical protein